MTQRYRTTAAHTWHRASVLVVFVVFCVHMHSFAGLIRRTPPPTFSDTAITDRHSDTTIFQLRAHWVLISWSIGLEKSFGHLICSKHDSYSQSCPNIPVGKFLKSNNNKDAFFYLFFLTLLHSEWPKLHQVLAILSATGLIILL